MNQKGFATIFSLCLMLIIALTVLGIQSAETNHTYETTAFQAEFDLQNAADSGVVEAAERVISGAVTIEKNYNPYVFNSRANHQYHFPATTKTSANLGKITVEVTGERVALQPYKVSYGTRKNTARRVGTAAEVYTFFSVASAVDNYTGAKIYRRAFGYVFVDDEAATIHFAEVPMSTYTYAD